MPFLFVLHAFWVCVHTCMWYSVSVCQIVYNLYCLPNAVGIICWCYFKLLNKRDINDDSNITFWPVKCLNSMIWPQWTMETTVRWRNGINLNQMCIDVTNKQTNTHTHNVMSAYSSTHNYIWISYMFGVKYYSKFANLIW